MGSNAGAPSEPLPRWALMAEAYGLEVSPLPEGALAQLQFLLGMSGHLNGQAVRFQEELSRARGRNRHQRGGLTLELGSVSVGTGVHHGTSSRNEQQTTRLVVRLETAPYLSQDLDASRENVLHKLVKAVTKGDQQVGDEALDQAIYFKVLVDEDREVLLRPEVRELLLQIFGLGASVRLYGGALTLTFARVPKDDVVEELLESLHFLVPALQGSADGRRARF